MASSFDMARLAESPYFRALTLASRVAASAKVWPQFDQTFSTVRPLLPTVWPPSYNVFTENINVCTEAFFKAVLEGRATDKTFVDMRYVIIRTSYELYAEEIDRCIGIRQQIISRHPMTEEGIWRQAQSALDLAWTKEVPDPPSRLAKGGRPIPPEIMKPVEQSASAFDARQFPGNRYWYQNNHGEREYRLHRLCPVKLYVFRCSPLRCGKEDCEGEMVNTYKLPVPWAGFQQDN